MSMLDRLGDAVRNSPLLNRKSAQSYSLTAAEDEDPFNKGITFYVDYIGSENLPKSAGKGVELNDRAVVRVYEREKGPFRRFSVQVTDKSLRLKDMATKQLIDDVPMYAISYCGTHTKYNKTFSFIARDHDTGNMRVHVMKTADRAKAQAMIVTVSKAFNIAFLAWQAKNKQRLRTDSIERRREKGSDSPRATKKIQELNAAVEKKKAEAAASAAASKPAPEQAAATADVTVKLADITVEDAAAKAKAKQEEAELEAMFTDLAASRSHPDLLDNDIGADPHRFSWDETKEHVDPGSTPNLLS